MNDPYSAFEELKCLHRKYRIAATSEEFRTFMEDNPDYKGGIPLFVNDFILNFRYFSVRQPELMQWWVSRHPQDYIEAIGRYVTQFPLDSEIVS
jgi:hypothetical protein